MIHIVAFGIAFLSCFGYAYTHGGRPERAAALAQLAALLVSLLTGFHHVPGAFRSVIAGWALADIALSAGLILLALNANRYWTIVLAGLQLAAVIVHAAKSVFPPLPAAGYAILLQFWAWPMLLVTAMGTYNHCRRVKLLGGEEDWKSAFADGEVHGN